MEPSASTGETEAFRRTSTATLLPVSTKSCTSSPRSTLVAEVTDDTALVVSRLVLDAFASLPRNGKPSDNQWTVLAGMVAVPIGDQRHCGTAVGPHSHQQQQRRRAHSDGLEQLPLRPQLISLATGTKCLGRSQRRPGLVSDSHAEVLARRLFNRQLLDEVRLAVTGGRSPLVTLQPSGLCAWRDDCFALYLYVSRAPCGDSAICDKQLPVRRTNEKQHQDASVRLERFGSLTTAVVDDYDDDDDDNNNNNKKHTDQDDDGNNNSICDNNNNNNNNNSDSLIADIHRTGAKPVPGAGVTDTLQQGRGYHTVGVLRTKPGRGEPTDCMSCSDKICRWVACGVQSRLVAAFLTGPIPLTGVVVGGEVFDEAALRRALVERHSCPLGTLAILAAPVEAVASATSAAASATSAAASATSTAAVSATSAAKATGATRFRYDRRPGAERCSTSVLTRWGGQHARGDVQRDVQHEHNEVAVDGRRHGIVKKRVGTPLAELSVCRRQLLVAFRELVRTLGQLEEGASCSVAAARAVSVALEAKLGPLATASYAETKIRVSPAWLTERRRLFDARIGPHWTTKDGAQDFHV